MGVLGRLCDCVCVSLNGTTVVSSVYFSTVHWRVYMDLKNGKCKEDLSCNPHIDSLCPFQENAKSDESHVLAQLLAEDKDEGPNGLVRSVCLFLFLCLGHLTTGCR